MAKSLVNLVLLDGQLAWQLVRQSLATYLALVQLAGCELALCLWSEPDDDGYRAGEPSKQGHRNAVANE